MREILGDCDMISGLPAILRAGSTSNGTFGVKIHWNHMRSLCALLDGRHPETQRLAPLGVLKAMRSHSRRLPQVAAARDALIEQFFDIKAASAAHTLLQRHIANWRFILLTREDRVARAISHYRARLSGVWWQAQAASGASAPEPDYEFSGGDIHDLHCLGSFHEACWQRYFQQHAIVPLQITYEELVSDYGRTVRRVYDHLEVPHEGLTVPQPESVRQADAISEAWALRYRQLLAADATG